MLTQANLRWHRILDIHFQAFLEALTEIDPRLYDAHWQIFKLALHTHIEFEQTHIEPLTANWKNNTLKLIQSDHLILMRLIPRIDTALIEISQADKPRTRMVEKLDTFIKMRNVLEHHDTREMEQLYPLLDKQIEHEQCQALASKMDAALTALSLKR